MWLFSSACANTLLGPQRVKGSCLWRHGKRGLTCRRCTLVRLPQSRPSLERRRKENTYSHLRAIGRQRPFLECTLYCVRYNCQLWLAWFFLGVVAIASRSCGRHFYFLLAPLRGEGGRGCQTDLSPQRGVPTGLGFIFVRFEGLGLGFILVYVSTPVYPCRVRVRAHIGVCLHIGVSLKS